MKFLAPIAPAAAAAALVLASGCASRQVLVPQVRSDTAAGARTVAVAPERLACSAGPRCPLLSAAWSSAKPGQAQLAIAVPGQQAAATGADVHIGGSETVRLRLPAENAASAAADGLPTARFDVPLRLVDRLAYAPNTWMRVYLAGGGHVDESVQGGEQRSRASEAMAHFLVAVQAAGGAGAGLEGARGGLFQRLGVGADQ